MSHLHSKAAEAAAASQVLHALQQQEADAAVKSAELAVCSLSAERRLAQAVESEAYAAGRLLQIEHAAVSNAGSPRDGRHGQQAQLDARLQQKLREARQQLEASVAARAAVQTEVQGLKTALAKEQKQVRRGGVGGHMKPRCVCWSAVEMLYYLFGQCKTATIL